MSDYFPKWHKELNIFSRINPLLIIEGNVLDFYQYPGNGYILHLVDYLQEWLSEAGYQTTAFFDSMQGYYHPADPANIERLAALTGEPCSNGRILCAFKGKEHSASSIARQAAGQHETSIAVVMNLASRYIVSPDRLDQQQVDSYTNLVLASMEAGEITRNNQTLKNLIIVIVNKLNDLPTWFYLDNPNAKTITIHNPTREERALFIKGDHFKSFFDREVYQEDIGYYDQNPDELEKVQDRFIGLTEGFNFTELNGLRKLSKNEKTRIRDLPTVIDLYRYGISENPWAKISDETLRTAPEDFRKRVKGQEYAIGKTLDVVKRAVTGLSGLQGSSHNRPKGILFFAGPTGTGKTETAKTLAEKLFGDEKRCIRFDMSEYGQAHSDQKLLGAPPGYVGYEAGGQLTNAVRENPFSILLFDEIEKAHPSILDKFLQILEDGRMTDGQGNTVYFSECIIIFTSNLGIYTMDPATGERRANVTADMPYAKVQKQVRGAIENYFKLDLGRPEILNRIGENIVVFDFIRPEVAASILDAQIEKIIRNLATEKHIAMKLEETARRTLLDRALHNLENGGRGIGNIVESYLIDPLARYLFDNRVADGSSVVIHEIMDDGTQIRIV